MTGDPATLQRMRGAAPGHFRPLHQPGGAAARLQHLHPRDARQRGALRHEPGPAARGTASPCCRARPCRRLVGGDLGRQRHHHGAHARPGAPAGHSGAGHLTELQPGKVVRATNIDGEEALIAVGRGHWSELDHRRLLSARPWSIGSCATLSCSGAPPFCWWAALVVGLAFLFGRTLTRPLAAATAAAGRAGPRRAVRHPRFAHPRGQRRQRGAACAPGTISTGLGGAAPTARSSCAPRRRQRSSARTSTTSSTTARTARRSSWRSWAPIRAMPRPPSMPASTSSIPTIATSTMRRKRQILEGAMERYQLEYRIRRRDGQVRWVMDRGQVIRDGDGKALRVVGVRAGHHRNQGSRAAPAPAVRRTEPSGEEHAGDRAGARPADPADEAGSAANSPKPSPSGWGRWRARTAC